MAAGETEEGSWLLAEEYFERGDPQFLEELRKVVEADRLGPFATRWYNDRRPWAREQLHAYLDLPLNAYRHDPLVKRLFKLAEAANDDRTMGRFLVCFDRSIRREHRHIRRTRNFYNKTQVEAQKIAQDMRQTYAADVGISPYGIGRNRSFAVFSSWRDEVDVTPPGTQMPREQTVVRSEWIQETRRWEKFEAQTWTAALNVSHWQYRESRLVPIYLRHRLKDFQLFSIRTRLYLRRRTWRYFRRLAHEDPARYRAAMVETLALYRDEDVRDTTALLDNWGMVHALFHNSEALEQAKGVWRIRPNRNLGQLEPSPYRAAVWNETPRPLFELLARSRCRTLRVWAARLARRDLAAVFASATLEEWLELLTRDDPALARLVESLIREAPGLSDLPPERWVAIARATSDSTVPIVADLVARYVRPETVPLPLAIEMARFRPLPFARLGLSWLHGKTPITPQEYELAWTLQDAEAEALRPEILNWLRGALQFRSKADPTRLVDDLLAFLDSRRSDARSEGWRWFQAELGARGNVSLWNRLMESPYDDIRLPLTAELQTLVDAQGAGTLPSLPLDQGRLQLLWATVLLNIHRGGNAKPRVLTQILNRLQKFPEEAGQLLPLVAVSLRSSRGPEWRAGLTTVVRLATTRPELAGVIADTFPELSIATA